MRVFSVLFAIAVQSGFISCDGAKSLPVEQLGILTQAGTIVLLETEIARTSEEQAKGYMERKTIADGTGMIFIYNQDRQMNFWMKNTPHALSIAFIDSSGIIREIYDMVPFSLETVSSSRSLRYALEVPEGWFTRTGITVGDALTDESLILIKSK